VKQAGDAFMKQGELMELIGERDESSGCYINASKCYKKEFPRGASNLCRSNQRSKACDIYPY
jgi:hypothetical protein